MEMYRALQHSLGPLSTPMFLTVCYSLYKAPRRPEDPLLASPLNPLTLPCTDPHSRLLLTMDHNALYEGNGELLFLLPESVSIKNKRQNVLKRQICASFLPCLMVISFKGLVRSYINCYLTPFNTPFT